MAVDAPIYKTNVSHRHILEPGAELELSESVEPGCSVKALVFLSLIAKTTKLVCTLK